MRRGLATVDKYAVASPDIPCAELVPLCRTFDCRNDRRIWLDYERRVPNPNVERLARAAANWRRNSAK